MILKDKMGRGGETGDGGKWKLGRQKKESLTKCMRREDRKDRRAERGRKVMGRAERRQNGKDR